MDINLKSLADNFDYMAVGREVCPTTDREHYQGFAYLSSPRGFGWWRKLLAPHHVELCYGSLQQNEKYCSKEGQYQEFGLKPMGNGHRRDLALAAEAIIRDKKPIAQIAQEYPVPFVQYHNGLAKLCAYTFNGSSYDHPTVRGVWIHGPPGTGKTTYARTRYTDIYIKAQNKWFDGYNGERTIVLDDFDCAHLSHYLKIWMDKWACTGEIKGGTINLRHHVFVVTSNYSIGDLFHDSHVVAALTRRCRVIDMTPL